MTGLERDLGEPAPVPGETMDRVRAILEGAQLTRYGEFKGEGSEVAALEREFAAYMGSRYAVAVNSGGSAIYLALLCAGVRPGDRVLLNAFTLAPVPGAIVHAGAEPLFVECNDDYVVDLQDLRGKAKLGARVLLLSHMRGHIGDMHGILNICNDHGIAVIEDCAHTLGAHWDGHLSGSFGSFGCFSLQAYKHINAGEGGLLTTNDEDAAARAILYSGSYMLYGQHEAAPDLAVFERHKHSTPNLSLRMPEVTAAIARAQLPLLEDRARIWNHGYAQLAKRLAQVPHVRLPKRDPREAFIGSSLQFSFEGLSATRIDNIVARCTERGLSLKWFGRAEPQGFTSTWEHWRYVHEAQPLQRTRGMLDGLIDMRIPLTITSADCALIGDILEASIEQTA